MRPCGALTARTITPSRDRRGRRGEQADSSRLGRKGVAHAAAELGGQRLFTEADRKKAVQIALLRRHRGWNPAAIQSWISAEPSAEVWGELAVRPEQVFSLVMGGCRPRAECLR